MWVRAVLVVGLIGALGFAGYTYFEKDQRRDEDAGMAAYDARHLRDATHCWTASSGGDLPAKLLAQTPTETGRVEIWDLGPAKLPGTASLVVQGCEFGKAQVALRLYHVNRSPDGKRWLSQLSSWATEAGPEDDPEMGSRGVFIPASQTEFDAMAATYSHPLEVPIAAYGPTVVEANGPLALLNPATDPDATARRTKIAAKYLAAGGRGDAFPTHTPSTE